MIRTQVIKYNPPVPGKGMLSSVSAIDSFAQGAIYIDVLRAETPLVFEGIYITRFLLDILYGILVASGYNRKTFTVSVPDRDELVSFLMADGMITSLKTSTVLGHFPEDFTLTDPITTEQVVKELVQLVASCSDRLRDDYSNSLFDPVMRMIFNHRDDEAL